MSLDVYLRVEVDTGGPEPIAFELFEANITHNLNMMAQEADLYLALWRPDELGIVTAGKLIPLLSKGLARLKAHPERYREFNPENGWGDYQHLVDFTEAYLRACRQHPKARVEVSR